MHRHTAGDSHPYGRDLAVGGVVHPHAAATADALTVDAEMCARVDEHLLESAHVAYDIHGFGKMQDRVTDELPGTVPGDPSATVHLDHRRPVDGPVLWLRASPGRVHGFVLQQQQRVGHVPGGDRAVDLALQLPGLQERDPTQVAHLQGTGQG